MIEAKNISKSYAEKPILKNLSFTLDTNSITVLFGPSGSGKTTLLRCLALLDHPDTGELKIFDDSYLFSKNRKARYEPCPKINLVYQQLYLYPHLSNRENILLALDDFDENKQQLFYEYIELLGIKEVIDNYPNQSSLGQKQRVAIARVLILEPEYIFFDEITSALDIVQTNMIIRLIKNLKANGIGSLIISHNMYLIENIADELLFIESGEIIEKGGMGILKQPSTDKLQSFLK